MCRSLTAAVLALALGAVGCGGGSSGAGSATTSSSTASKQQYRKQLQQTSQAISKTFSTIEGSGAAKETAKQATDRIRRSADALDEAANRFGKIKPPGDVQDAHAQLVQGLHELAAAFRKAGSAAAQKDAKALATALQGLTSSDGVRKIAAAQKKLAAKGIDLAQQTSTGGG